MQVHHHRIRPHPITFFVIILCTLLYFWNSAEQVGLLKADGRVGLEFGFTRVQQKLMFDYPEYNQILDQLIAKYSLKSFKDLNGLPPEELAQFKEAERIPTWRGGLPLLIQSFQKKENSSTLHGPLFQKIREGQYWRLFTPALLHGGFLHILFNMAWAFILIRQVEEHLAKWKTVLLILLLGIGANVAQYLVSGPYFLGFSGVVVGLVGFIWTRQKIAPWEGYPLQKSTIVFILIFIGAMFALELFALISALIAGTKATANIANTAHIVGGLIGLVLGRIPLFARKMK